MGINISRAVTKNLPTFALSLSLHSKDIICSKFRKIAWEKTYRGETNVHIASEHDSLILNENHGLFLHLTIKSNNRPNTAYLFTYFAIKSRDFGTGKNSISFFFFFYYYTSGKIQRRSGDDTVLR